MRPAILLIAALMLAGCEPPQGEGVVVKKFEQVVMSKSSNPQWTVVQIARVNFSGDRIEDISIDGKQAFDTIREKDIYYNGAFRRPDPPPEGEPK